MNNFTGFLLLELKRKCSKKYIIVLLLVFIFLMYYVQGGIDGFKAQDEKVMRFQDIYQKYFRTIGSYAVYSVYGIQVLFVKSKLDFLYRDAIVPEDLMSKFDSLTTLEIFNNFKGKSLSPAEISIDMDFAGIFMLLVSLLALFYGRNSFESKAYYRFLSSRLSTGRVHLYTVLSRICIIASAMVFLTAAIVIMMKINGLALSAGEYTGIWGDMCAAFIMVAFFFLLGVMTGAPRKGVFSGIRVLAAWFFFLFIVPGAINRIVDKHVPDTSANYQTGLDKFEILSNFEKRIAEEIGHFDRNKIESARKVIENYWNKENKEIEAVEQQLKERIISAIDHYKSLAVWTPVTFFQLTGNEVSSRGYENYFDFYSYDQELQQKFIRFYIDRCYYNDPKKLVSFIKANENLFYAKTRLPVNFWQGVIINLGILVIMVIITLFRFKKYIYAIEAKERLGNENHPIIVSKGELKALHMDKTKGLNEKLYNLLSGKLRTGETIKLEIDNVDYTDNRTRADFLCLCHPRQIPGDIKAGAFVSFILRLSGLSRKEKKAIYASLRNDSEMVKIKRKTFSELTDRQKGNVFSTILPYLKHKIYLVDNVCLDMPDHFVIELNDIMLGWAGSGSSVIYLTTEKEVKVNDFKKEYKGRDFREVKMWSQMVSRLKELDIPE